MLKITRKNTLLLGTLILTASGIICRILGFLYRIFLSRRIGAEAFGIYQLATPLYALMLSLGAGGMQTVLSRFVASYLAKKDSRRAKICLAAGCGIVVILSFSASIFLFFSADFIGTRLLFEPRTILLLRILSLGILPSGIHNCLSAWYLGQNQTALPSFCQLLEQFVRMGASYLAWLFCLSTSLPSAAVAAFGTAAGELFSCLFLMACLSVSHSRSPQKHRPISVFFKEKTLWYDTFRELAVLNLHRYGTSDDLFSLRRHPRGVRHASARRSKTAGRRYAGANIRHDPLYNFFLCAAWHFRCFCLFLFRSVAWTFPFSKRRSRRFSAYPFIFKSFSLSGNDTWKHFKRPWKNFSRFFPEPCRRCNSYSCNSFSRPGFRHPWLSLWYSCK